MIDIRHTKVIGSNKCNVTESWWENVIEACKCIEIGKDENCQLKLVTRSDKLISCKPDASSACKSATMEWADAYKNATNANDCKGKDPQYNYSQATVCPRS